MCRNKCYSEAYKVRHLLNLIVHWFTMTFIMTQSQYKNTVDMWNCLFCPCFSIQVDSKAALGYLQNCHFHAKQWRKEGLATTKHISCNVCIHNTLQSIPYYRKVHLASITYRLWWSLQYGEILLRAYDSLIQHSLLNWNFTHTSNWNFSWLLGYLSYDSKT